MENSTSMDRRSLLKGGALAAGLALFGGSILGSAPQEAQAAGAAAYIHDGDVSTMEPNAKKGTVDFAKMKAGKLVVGAAHTDIDLSGYLPMHDKNSQAGAVLYTHEEKDYTAQREGHELRFGLVLIDFDDVKYAIIDCDHVNPPAGFIDNVKAKVKELCDVPLENQWFHNPHNIVAPHSQTYEMTEPAVIEACEKALASKAEATFGYGEGITYMNINRCYETAKGWQQISNEMGNCDNVLPIMRFDNAKTGNPIAILYTAHSASGTLENAMNADADGKTEGTIDSRTITTDIAGLSAKYVEEYFGNGCVALYFAGATGDQWGAMRAEINYLKVSPKDNIEYVERTYLPVDDQWKILDIASSRLGYAVIDAANEIQTGELHKIGMSHKKCTYDKLNTDKRGKTAPFHYEQAVDDAGIPATIDMNICVMAFDDVAVTGVKSEMNIQTLKDIRVASPYTHNVMQGWVAFDSSDPDGYLPDQEGFDQSGKQASKTKFMPGTAEEVVADAVELLDELYA